MRLKKIRYEASSPQILECVEAAEKTTKRKLLVILVEKICLILPIKAWCMSAPYVEIFIVRIAGKKWKERFIQWKKKESFFENG